MKKEDFYTKPNADKGVKMPLLTADGTDSGHWLMVRGTESDAFRKARFEGSRVIRDLPEKMGEWERAKAMDGVILDNLVSLVAGWSFDEPFTDEAVREFLSSAPQVANAVDTAAADRARFFGLASES
ncbi:MAG TPA: phage tail assembly chaperone [Pseudomonas sp.]|nr:phage tail assembly chaperone [Pseudomonas sp.]